MSIVISRLIIKSKPAKNHTIKAVQFETICGLDCKKSTFDYFSKKGLQKTNDYFEDTYCKKFINFD